MTLVSTIRLFSLPVTVAITAWGLSGLAAAADQPVVVAGHSVAGCATCTTGTAPCSNAHKSLFHHHKACTPQLCPGACFGYFQTQWHKWENVCPLPYQGVGLTDAPVIPPAVVPKTGSDLPVPKPVVPPVPEKK